MTPQTILFIGPQGSGKGTQVRNLIKYLKKRNPECVIMDIETGRLFRNLAETKNTTASRVKELIENGKPVPDFVTNSFVMEDFKNRYSPNVHITLDGFPRNVEQAKFLDEIFTFYDRKQMTVVYLDTPEEVVRKRMMSRGRHDDTEEKITERLRWSTEMMKEMITYYQSRPQTNFLTINGTYTIDAIQAEIQNKLIFN